MRENSKNEKIITLFKKIHKGYIPIKENNKQLFKTTIEKDILFTDGKIELLSETCNDFYENDEIHSTTYKIIDATYTVVFRLKRKMKHFQTHSGKYDVITNIDFDIKDKKRAKQLKKAVKDLSLFNLVLNNTVYDYLYYNSKENIEVEKTGIENVYKIIK